MKKEKPKRCSICKLPYYGFGHNAEPINGGICCDNCNQIVIAVRIRNLFAMLKNEKKKKREND